MCVYVGACTHYACLHPLKHSQAGPKPKRSRVDEATEAHGAISGRPARASDGHLGSPHCLFSHNLRFDKTREHQDADLTVVPPASLSQPTVTASFRAIHVVLEILNYCGGLSVTLGSH